MSLLTMPEAEKTEIVIDNNSVELRNLSNENKQHLALERELREEGFDFDFINNSDHTFDFVFENVSWESRDKVVKLLEPYTEEK